MKKVNLEEVCVIKNGYAFKSEDYKSSGVPLLRISNFDDSDVLIDDNSIYLDSEFLKTKVDFIVEKGDILIALSGATTGKYGYYNYDFPSLLNQRIGLLKSGTSKNLFDRYFYHYLTILKSEVLRNAGGAAQPNISTKAIGKLQIPLPPLTTQKKIAAILDAADEYRQKTKTLIEKYDQLAQSLFLEMFGDISENPFNFKQTSLSDFLPEKKSIICGPFGSQLKIGEYIENGVPVYGIDNVGVNMFIDSKPKFITEKKFKDLIAFNVKENDVLITRTGTVGRTCLAPKNEKAVIGPNLLRIRIQNNEILPIFLSFAFNYSTSIKKQIEMFSPGATVAVYNTGNLKKLKIIVPPIDVQSDFVERVQLIEQQKQQAQASLQRAEELFSSLLQRAFSGELVKE